MIIISTIQQSLLLFMSISNHIMIPGQLAPTQTHFPLTHISSGPHSIELLHSTYETTHYL